MSMSLPEATKLKSIDIWVVAKTNETGLELLTARLTRRSSEKVALDQNNGVYTGPWQVYKVPLRFKYFAMDEIMKNLINPLTGVTRASRHRSDR